MEIKKDLVSIVTPCYNGANHITRLLDSILEQSYPHVEHYVIDDGSVDNSASIIKSYIPLYENKGYSLTYIYQDNSGQSVALDKGLKLIKGEYFVWPDADDFYAISKAIEVLVGELRNSDGNTSTVRSFIRFLDEDTLEEISKTDASIDYSTDLFEDCLIPNNFWFVPGTYMCKTKSLFQSIPTKSIYTEKDAGQNWQLMLPLFYKQKCITIRKYLYNVLARSDSHSRGQYDTLEKSILKYQSYENTIINTLDRINSMPNEEKENYKRQIHDHYQLLNVNLHFNYKENKLARKLYKELSSINQSTKLRYCCSYLPFGSYVFRAFVKVKSIVFK